MSLSSHTHMAVDRSREVYRGSNGLGITGLGPMLDPFAKTADNFCAQAWYFVHVTFAALRRNRSLAPLLQKNTMVSTQNVVQDCTTALQGQMASESLLRAS